MASVEKRVSKNGKTVTWRVTWREGGKRTGARDSETCDSKTTAENFASLVRLAGHHRPEGYPQGCRGIKPIPSEAPAPQQSPATEPQRMTMDDLIAEYFDFLRETDKAEPVQVATYERRWAQHGSTAVVTLPDGTRVGPLGSLPVEDFTAEVDQAWVKWMGSRAYVKKKAQKSGENDDIRRYSAKTIHNIHGEVISPAVGWAAARRGLLPANPCADVVLPKKNGKSVNRDHVPMGEEIEQWIAIGYKVSNLAGDIISLALGTGLRWAEMTALRPCDVDFERGTLTVAQVVKQDEKRRPYIAPYGKSNKALRTIRIPARLVEMLWSRCEGKASTELIFRGARGGILRNNTWYKVHWLKVVKIAAAQEITTQASAHRFRHAHATALLAENVSLDTVSKRLGHESIVITSDLYSHLSPEADRSAVTVIEAAMGGPPRLAVPTA